MAPSAGCSIAAESGPTHRGPRDRALDEGIFRLFGMQGELQSPRGIELVLRAAEISQNINGV